MSNNTVSAEEFKNSESPFTEIFSLLRRYENTSNDSPTFAYDSHDLKIMHQHIDNAIDVLLQGLQDLGQLMSMVMQDKKQTIDDLYNIGFFVSAIANLTEALNALRLDTDYVLKQRGMIELV